MCGIVGIHGPQQEEWIEIMNQMIVHRGPDDDGVYRHRAADLSLGMRRLAILDLATGKQPMSTRDGRFTIVFNGEIYNAPLLRRELEQRGVEFVTDHSDTEVVLQFYALDGEAMLNKLNGMFALAIYDRDQATLFCARDRMGIKPFYYTYSEGRFVFASELKAILALPVFEADIDKQSLFHYMSLMYVPGEDTIIRRIKRLPAGHFLMYRLNDGAVSKRRWWRPTFSASSVEARKNEDLIDEIRQALQQAVERWTLSDVPIACSLSGGLDSSSIVGMLASTAQPVSTYSLGFSGTGEESWNELPLARAVARKWGTRHHELVLNEEALLDDLLPMTWYLDEPYGGGLPSWMVFKTMSQDVKVGLTGTGGDELFGNYGKWRAVEGGPVRRLFGGEVTKERFREEFFNRFYYLSDSDKQHIALSDSHKGFSTADMLWDHYCGAGATTIRDKIAYTDINTQLPEEFLMMTDRFSMAHSLEARTPFLDHELVELILSIPSHRRTHRRDLKGLLRKTVADLLPPELLTAPKRGFVIPLTLWLRGRLRPLVDCLLDPARLKRQEIFRPEFYEAFVKPHLDGRADHTNKVWAALMFQLWFHLFIENKTASEPNYSWKAILS